MSNEMTENDKKRSDLTYGLLYPAVLGAGLVVLLTHIVAGPPDTHIWDRGSLGVITLSIYCASYAAFADAKKYPKSALFLDLGEVGVIFGCLWALGLLDANRSDPLHYGTFFGLLAFDLLVVQLAWRGIAIESKNPLYFLEFRIAVVALLLIGFAPCARFWIAIPILILVYWYEVTPTWYSSWRSRHWPGRLWPEVKRRAQVSADPPQPAAPK